jgi:hypothetical protein
MPRYLHWPAFDRLCDVAERTGLQVRLVAGERVTVGRKKGEEYRRLTCIELWPMGSADRRVESAPIYEGDLEVASLDLLARTA